MSGPEGEQRQAARPARYGAFHRLASPTQTEEDARKQRESGQIWGRTPRTGITPQVKAYPGPLPDEADGIEFFTDSPSDEGENLSPMHHWSGPEYGGSAGVDEEFARIAVW